MEYGQWCTIGGKRWMILDAGEHTVTVYDSNTQDSVTFDKSDASHVSDFLLTDADRKALGYAF